MDPKQGKENREGGEHFIGNMCHSNWAQSVYVILALQGPRQVDCKFKVSLSFRNIEFRSAWLRV